MKKFYTAKYDRVFKTILCDEEDTSLLQEFLSRILKKKVEVTQVFEKRITGYNIRRENENSRCISKS